MRNVVHKTESFSSIFVLLWSFSQVRELVTGAENCPYDWVRLYDGVDEYSPLIGHFCGTGSFPRFFAMFISLQITEAQVNNRKLKQALPWVCILPCRTPSQHWLWLQVIKHQEQGKSWQEGHKTNQKAKTKSLPDLSLNCIVMSHLRSHIPGWRVCQARERALSMDLVTKFISCQTFKNY